MVDTPISAELDALCTALIACAIDILDAAGELPVMLATDAGGGAESFEGDDADVCYLAACDRVSALGGECTRYALAYEGIADDCAGGGPCDAIIFEFAERGMECAWSGFVACTRTDDGELEVAEPRPAGAERLLFG